MQCMHCGKTSKYTMSFEGVVDKGYGPEETIVTCCRNGVCLAAVFGVPAVPHKFHFARPNDMLSTLPDNPAPGFIGRGVWTRYHRNGFSESWCVAMICEICTAKNVDTFCDEVSELKRLIQENKPNVSSRRQSG